MSLGVKSESSETVEELTVDDCVDSAISAELQANEIDVSHVRDDDVITRH